MKNIVELWKRSAQRWATRPFLLESGHTWTYAQIDDRVKERHQLLLEKGVCPHHRVLHQGRNSVEWVVQMLATKACKATFVPISPDVASHSTHLLSIHKTVQHNTAPRGWEKVSASDLAVILFTSGTTATPKGVLLSENNLLSNLGMIDRRIPSEIISHRDRSFAFLPWCHSYGLVGEFLFLLSRGASLYLPSSKDPRTLVSEIRGARPTLLFTVPRMLEKIHHLSDSMWYLPHVVKKRLFFGPRVRYLSVGGAPVSTATLKFFQDKWTLPVFQGYGLTETGPMISLCSLERGRTGSCGPLLDEVSVDFRNGQMAVQSPSVSHGYCGEDNTIWRPEDKFTEDGWFLTGDAMRVDKEDDVYFEHRQSGLMKLPGGKFVDPVFLEKAILEIPGVEQAAVLGDLRLLLYAPRTAPTLDTLHHHLATRGFQRYEWPRKIVWLETPLSMEKGTLSLKQEPVRHVLEKMFSSSSNTTGIPRG